MISKQVSLLLLSCIVVLSGTSVCSAQGSPSAYMNEFTVRETALSEKYMSYMSEIAHRGRARKMEKRRMEVITSTKQSIREVSAMKPFEGDATLRDAYKNYWSVVVSILNEDYAKIVDMEEVAEQSYDAMEAYLLIQEKATEKLQNSAAEVGVAYNTFADNHHVRLISGGDSELSRKLEKTGLVNQYTNQVFLIFFKSFVQESSMLNGLNSKDINAIEQAKGSLKKFSAEGLSKLDTLKPFQNDKSLTMACRNVLNFHQTEADKFEQFTSFLIKREDFEKYKKTFDAKPASKRTQADVDQYNKLLNEYNGSIKSYNQVNDELNTNRTKTLDGFNRAKARFMDTHVPRG